MGLIPSSRWNYFKTALCGDFLLFALACGSYIAVNTYLPMWAQALLGTSALLGGITLIPNSLVSIIGSTQAGRAQREWTFFKVMLISLLCMLTSASLLLFARINTAAWLLAIFGSFAGFGVGLCFVSLQVKVQVDAGKKMMATATSTPYLVTSTDDHGGSLRRYHELGDGPRLGRSAPHHFRHDESAQPS